MKRVRWLSGLFLAGMLCVMLGTVGGQVAQAQRPIHILDLQCLVTKGTLAVGGRNSGGLADLYKGPTDISALHSCGMLSIARPLWNKHISASNRHSFML